MALRGYAGPWLRQTVELLLRPLRKHRDLLDRTSQHALYKASMLVLQCLAVKSQALPVLLPYLLQSRTTKGQALLASFPYWFQSHFEA